MGKNQLLATAGLLYAANLEIKRLTELADGYKRDLRENIPEEGLDIGTAICKKVTQTTPEINNKKLYKLLTFEELIIATKPIMAEIKKVLDEEVIEKCATGWKTTECIKFYPAKDK